MPKISLPAKVGELYMGRGDELRPFSLEPTDIDVLWDYLEPFIERSIKHSQGSMTVRGVKKLLLSNHAICMGTARGGVPVFVAVAQITDYMHHKAGTVIAAAGNELKESHKYIYILEEWAYMLGATELEAYCRPSMVRLLQRFGYRPKFTVVSKSLARSLQ